MTTRRPPHEPALPHKPSDDLELDFSVDDEFHEESEVFERPTMIPDVPPHMALDPRQIVGEERALRKTTPPPSAPRIEVGEATWDDDLGDLGDPRGDGRSESGLIAIDSIPPLAQVTVASAPRDPFSESPDDDDPFALPPPRSQAPTLLDDDAGRFDLSHTPTPSGAFLAARAHADEPRPSGPVTMRAPPQGGDSIGHALEQLAAHRGAADNIDLDADAPASSDMRDRFALGDYSGALVAAEAILSAEPTEGEASRIAGLCRDKLQQMYAAKLGSLSSVPRVVLPPDQIRWLSLDHRAGFILSCIDGCSSIEELLDVSGMAPVDALRVLYDLQQQHVIAVS